MQAGAPQQPVRLTTSSLAFVRLPMLRPRPHLRALSPVTRPGFTWNAPPSQTDGQLAVLRRTENCTPQSSIGRTSAIRRKPASTAFRRPARASRPVSLPRIRTRHAAGLGAQALYRPRPTTHLFKNDPIYGLEAAYCRVFGAIRYERIGIAGCLRRLSSVVLPRQVDQAQRPEAPVAARY